MKYQYRVNNTCVNIVWMFGFLLLSSSGCLFTNNPVVDRNHPVCTLLLQLWLQTLQQYFDGLFAPKKTKHRFKKKHLKLQICNNIVILSLFVISWYPTAELQSEKSAFTFSVDSAAVPVNEQVKSVKSLTKAAQLMRISFKTWPSVQASIEITRSCNYLIKVKNVTKRCYNEEPSGFRDVLTHKFLQMEENMFVWCRTIKCHIIRIGAVSVSKNEKRSFWLNTC